MLLVSMKYLLLFFVLLLSAARALPEQTRFLDAARIHPRPVGDFLLYYQEKDTPLNLEQAIQAYQAGLFLPSRKNLLRFGLKAHPVWLRLAVRNPKDQPLLRRLSVERAWLDKLDFFVMEDHKLVRHWVTGDSLPFAKRPVNSRIFAFDHAYRPGETIVFIRAETAEAMVLPVYFSTLEGFFARQNEKAYWYGIVYGGLAILIGYNLILFLNLRKGRYLFYSLYLFSFLLGNMGYTGHAFQYLWPAHPEIQQWSIPFLFMLFMVFGLIFASSFLDIRRHFPRLFRGILVAIGCLILTTVTLFLAREASLLFVLSAGFLLIFSLAMILIGLLSWRRNVPSAKYFLLASITHTLAMMTSIAIVAMALPVGEIPAHLIEGAMLIDAVLLAFALADQFRILQRKKLVAEKLASIDPLTGMYNRRGFQDLVTPLWNTGLRNHHHMAVILIDLDRFKAVNDRFGHTTGDRILRAFAQMLDNNARAGDILARWGGEEFILFLPETSFSEAVNMAERLRRSVLRMDTGEKGLQLTASFGVAHAGPANIGIDLLIQQADINLYRAKELGRNQVFAGTAILSKDTILA